MRSRAGVRAGCRRGGLTEEAAAGRRGLRVLILRGDCQRVKVKGVARARRQGTVRTRLTCELPIELRLPAVGPQLARRARCRGPRDGPVQTSCCVLNSWSRRLVLT